MTGVAICVPVLDERWGLADVLPRVARALAGIDTTVCIVDDGSRDGTLEWLDAWTAGRAGYHVLRRRKIGRACLRGAATRDGLRWLLRHTAHGVFVDLDADGAQPPEEIPIALAHLDAHPACDVVVASKYASGSLVTGRPWWRRTGSLAYNGVLRVGLSPSLRDYSSSYRCYRRRAAELVAGAETRHDTAAFLVEMVAVWLAAGLRIDELPTRYVERTAGRSKMDWREAARGFAGACDVIRGARRGRYRVEGKSAEQWRFDPK